MMYESPQSLVELCLDCIAERHADVFVPCTEHAATGATSITDEEEEEDEEEQQQRKERDALRFPDADFYLIGELSERLLERFGARRLLDDRTLSLFRARNTRLRRVRIRDAQIAPDVLRDVLHDHHLAELRCANVEGLSVGGVLDCLGAGSVSELRTLDVSRCAFTSERIERDGGGVLMRLSRLTQLRSLSVAFTGCDQATLEALCSADLPLLERLDISGTRVRCARPLLRLRQRLRTLIASDVRAINAMATHIIELESLRHLDISLVHERFDGGGAAAAGGGGERPNGAVEDVLGAVEKLPQLVSLELSGWRELIAVDTLLVYVRAHPHLRYVGLVLNPVAFELCDDHLSPPLRDVRFAGLGSEAQILLALRRHHERHAYAQKALYHLFQLTDAFAASRADVFELVVRAMAAHARRFGVQMAATACLYNLTRGELARQIHPARLARAVALTLDAMAAFPSEYQLQKNALLTLCNDRILQEVGFERFRCARIVLDALCAFDEVNMNRMSVAICSILAAKISTRETSELGGRAAYMQKLLAMVRARVAAGSADITMKFTLSALWNLTDESAPTCAVFLRHGGAELFLDVLRVFRGDAAVETKVLGLLNNIAEVGALRARLLADGALVAELRALLAYDLIDVSYFAAGIVAHLACAGDAGWPPPPPTAEDDATDNSLPPREQLLVALETAVVGWGVPDNEMVAYRSFKPFFPLLRVGVDYRVQLWAVWAVHHVCTKNSKRYCDMLKEENGVELLQRLLDDAGTHEMAAAKCREVLRHIAPTPKLDALRTNTIVCTATIIDATAAALQDGGGGGGGGGAATHHQHVQEELRQ